MLRDICILCMSSKQSGVFFWEAAERGYVVGSERGARAGERLGGDARGGVRDNGRARGMPAGAPQPDAAAAIAQQGLAGGANLDHMGALLLPRDPGQGSQIRPRDRLPRPPGELPPLIEVTLPDCAVSNLHARRPPPSASKQ